MSDVDNFIGIARSHFETALEYAEKAGYAQGGHSGVACDPDMTFWGQSERPLRDAYLAGRYRAHKEAIKNAG